QVFAGPCSHRVSVFDQNKNSNSFCKQQTPSTKSDSPIARHWIEMTSQQSERRIMTRARAKEEHVEPEWRIKYEWKGRKKTTIYSGNDQLELQRGGLGKAQRFPVKAQATASLRRSKPSIGKENNDPVPNKGLASGPTRVSMTPATTSKKNAEEPELATRSSLRKPLRQTTSLSSIDSLSQRISNTHLAPQNFSKLGGPSRRIPHNLTEIQLDQLIEAPKEIHNTPGRMGSPIRTKTPFVDVESDIFEDNYVLPEIPKSNRRMGSPTRIQPRHQTPLSKPLRILNPATLARDQTREAEDSSLHVTKSILKTNKSLDFFVPLKDADETPSRPTRNKPSSRHISSSSEPCEESDGVFNRLYRSRSPSRSPSEVEEQISPSPLLKHKKSAESRTMPNSIYNQKIIDIPVESEHYTDDSPPRALKRKTVQIQTPPRSLPKDGSRLALRRKSLSSLATIDSEEVGVITATEPPAQRLPSTTVKTPRSCLRHKTKPLEYLRENETAEVSLYHRHSGSDTSEFSNVLTSESKLPRLTRSRSASSPLSTECGPASDILPDTLYFSDKLVPIDPLRYSFSDLRLGSKSKRTSPPALETCLKDSPQDQLTPVTHNSEYKSSQKSKTTNTTQLESLNSFEFPHQDNNDVLPVRSKPLRKSKSATTELSPIKAELYATPDGLVDRHSVLQNIVVYLDVRTIDGDDASAPFVDLIKSLGGRIAKSWNSNHDRSNHNITHVIFKDGSPRTLAKIKETNGAVKCVGLSWVMACEKVGRQVEEAGFEISVEQIPYSHRRRKSMETKTLSTIADVTPAAKDAPTLARVPQTCPGKSNRRIYKPMNADYF
ncbi:Microcephalin, partial [Neolecta irregularis DAH-3]